MNIKTIKVQIFEKDLLQKVKPFLIIKEYSSKSKNKFLSYFLFGFNSILLFPIHLTRSLILFPLRVLGFANGYEKPNWEPIPTLKTYFDVTRVDEYIESATLESLYFLKVDFTSNINGEDKNGSLYCTDFDTYTFEKPHILSVKENKIFFNKMLSINAHDISDFDNDYEIVNSTLESGSNLPSSDMSKIGEWKQSYSKLVKNLENKFGLNVINMHLFELPVWSIQVKGKNSDKLSGRIILIDASKGKTLNDNPKNRDSLFAANIVAWKTLKEFKP